MLDLLRDSVHLYNMCTTNWQKTTIEGDCIVPDSLPDIQNISAADVTVKNNSISRTADGVLVNFTIIYKIVYIPITESFPEETNSKNIKTFAYTTESSVVFTDVLPEDCKTFPDFGIESTEASIVNSRKIALKTICNVRLNTKFSSEEYICNGITGSDNVQYQKDIIPLITFEDYITDSIVVNEGIELSAIKAPYKEIIKSDTALRNVSTSVDNDSLILKGNLEISTLYIADDITNSLQIIENEISFIHNISIDNADNKIWNTELFLDNIDVSIVPDSDNENRILQIKGSISINAYSYKTCNTEILTDAYSLCKDLVLERKSITAFCEADNIYSQFVFKESVLIDENLPTMSEIINTSADLCEYSFMIDDDKIDVNGFLTVNIFYLSADADSPISTTTVKLPFSHTVENIFSEAEILHNLSLNINHISYNILSENEVDLRISISIKGIIAKVCHFETIIDAKENDILPSDSEKPAILLYVVQADDSLWKVAKRYNAPIEILKEINHIKESDSIIPGQKLLIPC